MLVRQSERVVVGLGAHDREHGAEDLLFVNAHIGGDVVEERTADVKAFLVALHREAAAVDDKARAFRDAHVDVAFHLLEVLRRDERSEVGIECGGGAHFQAFDARGKLLHQPVGGVFANRYGDRDRHAALAGRTVAGADQCIDGLVHVGIG